MNWYKLALIEPRKPTGPVRRRNIVKDEGTARAHNVIQFQFKTKLGNVVKFWMTPKGDDIYDVLFYVNDTLDDASSAKGQDGMRDPEVLPAVLHLMKTKANDLGAKQLTFSAWKGQKDTQTFKGVDVQPYARAALQSLMPFKAAIDQYEVKMIEPSPNLVRLFQMQGKTPQARPDLAKDGTLTALQNLIAAINSNADPVKLYQACDQFDEHGYSIDWQKFGIDARAALQAVKNLRGAAWSNVEGGTWQKDRNRRGDVYAKLMQRHFSQEWNVKQEGDRFELTRKPQGAMQ